jgi:hypothetical protein
MLGKSGMAGTADGKARGVLFSLFQKHFFPRRRSCFVAFVSFLTGFYCDAASLF